MNKDSRRTSETIYVRVGSVACADVRGGVESRRGGRMSKATRRAREGGACAAEQHERPVRVTIYIPRGTVSVTVNVSVSSVWALGACVRVRREYAQCQLRSMAPHTGPCAATLRAGGRGSDSVRVSELGGALGARAGAGQYWTGPVGRIDRYRIRSIELAGGRAWSCQY